MPRWWHDWLGRGEQWILSLDFIKCFNTVSYKFLIEKLRKCGLDEWRGRWLGIVRELWSAAPSAWRPVASSVPQGSVLGPVFFNLFVHDLDEGTMFVEDTQLGGAADTPEDCAAIQPHWARLEKEAGRNQQKQVQGPAPGESNPRYQHRLGTDLLESSSGE